MSTEPTAGTDDHRSRLTVVLGWIGVASVALGYLLEAVRQRGDCDAGDRSPDTLPLEVVLIVLVGGLLQMAVISVRAVTGLRRGESLGELAVAVWPSLVSLAGSLMIFVVAGSGPSTWFQYCAT